MPGTQGRTGESLEDDSNSGSHGDVALGVVTLTSDISV